MKQTLKQQSAMSLVLTPCKGAEQILKINQEQKYFKKSPKCDSFRNLHFQWETRTGGSSHPLIPNFVYLQQVPKL